MEWITYTETTPIEFVGTRRDYIENMLNIIKYEQPENYTANSMYAMEYIETLPQATSKKSHYTLTEHMFITVTSYEDYSFKNFLKKIADFVNRKTILNYVYVIEQRGFTEETCGVGFHAHILCTHNYDRISHFDREVKSTFKRVCNTELYKCFNIRSCEKEIDIPNTIQYMLGDKVDKTNNPKQLKQKFDTVMRRKNKLKNYYFKGYEEELEKYPNIQY